MVHKGRGKPQRSQRTLNRALKQYAKNDVFGRWLIDPEYRWAYWAAQQHNRRTPQKNQEDVKI